MKRLITLLICYTCVFRARLFEKVSILSKGNIH